MVDKYVVCRSQGHAFRRSSRIDPELFPDLWEDWLTVVPLRCPDCTTVRFDGLNSVGDVVRRKYNYPSDYRYPENETPTRSEFRLMALLLEGLP